MAGALAWMAAVASTAQAVVNDPPVSPHSILIFPVRDFVSADGYGADQQVTVQVLRAGSVIGSSNATANADGLVEVNHPAAPGDPQNCWDVVTPDIREGDVVRILTRPDEGDQGIVQGVHVTEPAALVGSDIVVKGIAQDAVTGAPLPEDQLEQRIIVPGTSFELNGKRSIRADAVASGDGTLSYDAPGSTHWTAVFSGLSANDRRIAVNGESRMLWLGPNPAAAAPPTSTIDEFGAPPGPGAPCTAPLATGPSTPDLIAADDSGVSSTDNITNVNHPTFTGALGNSSATTVNLYADGTLAATATPSGGAYSLTVDPLVYTPGALADGAHTMRVGEVVGGVETLSGGTLQITVDTSAPGVPVVSGTTPSGSGTTLRPLVFGRADPDSIVSLFTRPAVDVLPCSSAVNASGPAATFNGAGIAATVPPNSSTIFEASASDLAGNTSACSATSVSYVNDSRPLVTFTSKPAVVTNQTSATFAFTSSQPSSTFECSMDGEPFAACTSPVSDPGMADGAHTFTVRATAGGVTGPDSSYGWTIDTGPVSVETTVLAAAVSNDNTPTFEFISNKSTATFECSLVQSGPAVFSSCTSPKTYPARANGTWFFTVRATDPAGNVAVSTPYSFVIDIAAPNAPGGLTAAQAGAGAIRLTWTAATDVGPAGVRSYNIYRDSSVTPVANVLAPATTFTDTGLASGSSHTYTVQSVDGATNVSAKSAPATGTVASDLVAPSTPTGLTATAASSSSIRLSWTASTDNVAVTGYRVYRDGGAAPITTVTAGTSFTDTGLLEATRHSYTVTAIDGSRNESPQSGGASATTLDVTAPGIPGSVSATALSATSIQVTWTASSDNVGVTGYRVYRDGAATALATVTGTTFTDAGVGATTTHSYTVSAIDAAANESAKSAPASATTPATPDTAAPTQPGGLTAAATSSSSIRLSWTASTDNVGVTGYRVYRDGGITPLTTVTGATTFTDTALGEATLHSYTVSAIDAAGNESAKSLAASARTNDVSAPTVPQNLSATAASSTSIRLSWTASTDNVGVTGYQVFRDGGATPITTVTGTTFTDTGLGATTTHAYTVAAIDAAGNASAPSASASATTSAAPDTTAPTVPTGLTAAPLNTTSVQLSWSASTDNVGVTGYRVYRDGGLTAITTVTGTTFTDTGLGAGTTHSYTVSAIDAAANESAKSAPASVATSPPTNPVRATAPVQRLVSGVTLTDGQVPFQLTWSATSTAGTISRYDLQQSTNGGTTWTAVTLPTATTTSLSRSLVAGSYTYRVRATDSAGNVGAWVAGTAFTTSATQENGAGLAYAGTWAARAALTGAYGGFVRSSTTVGASVTFTFTGRNVSFVSTKGNNRGRVTISVDGGAATTVDLFQSTQALRRAVWVRTGLASGTHTVKVSVTTKNASSTGTRVDIDAFTVTT